MSKVKKLSKKEHRDLFDRVDQEGFAYYMLHYGPDLDAIERLGFNKEEVEAAIKLFDAIEEKINEGQDLDEN